MNMPSTLATVHILFVLFFAAIDLPWSTGLHLEGTWKPYQRYRFLTKFGFQRTQVDELEATRGYVFGTVQLKEATMTAVENLATLVLVDSEFILALYGNASDPVWSRNVSGLGTDELDWLIETERCRRMFAKIDAIAWHKTCAPNGQMDLLRSVPCPSGGLCGEEDNPDKVISGTQFTYTVQDLRQPRYWYLSLVACARNQTTCAWETTSVPRPRSNQSLSALSLDYSIWLVNGAPKLQGYNKFEYEFSFENHETVEIFLVFLILYLLLGLVSHIKLFNHFLVHTGLFLAHIWLCFGGALLTCLHLGVFSINGQGLGQVSQLGTLFTQWADALFLVLIISTAEVGFTPSYKQHLSQMKSATAMDNGHQSSITTEKRAYLYHRLGTQPNGESQRSSPKATVALRPSWPFLSCLIALFLFVQTVLYVWASIDQDPVIDFYVWNTVPGCLLLAVRFAVAFWFLAILRRRQLELDDYMEQRNHAPVDKIYMELLGPGIDLVHFAAGFLLWMFVLPLVVFIAETSVSSLWRSKAILSVCLPANYIAGCVYAYLLFRSWKDATGCYEIGHTMSDFLRSEKAFLESIIFLEQQ